MNNNSWIWWLIGAIIVVGGGYFVWQNMSNTPAADTSSAAVTGSTNGNSVDVNDAGPDANTSVEAN